MYDTLKHNTSCRIFELGCRPVRPWHVAERITAREEEPSGVSQADRLKGRPSEFIRWIGMGESVKWWIRRCYTCQARKST